MKKGLSDLFINEIVLAFAVGIQWEVQDYFQIYPYRQ